MVNALGKRGAVDLVRLGTDRNLILSRRIVSNINDPSRLRTECEGGWHFRPCSPTLMPALTFAYYCSGHGTIIFGSFNRWVLTKRQATVMPLAFQPWRHIYGVLTEGRHR